MMDWLATGVKAIVLWITLIVCIYASNDTGFLKVTDYDCGCPGHNASYLCTAVGGIYTVWAGTALTDCSVGNKINLRHHEFDNAAGECNNGAIVGYSIGIINDSYTSRLDVLLSDELREQLITCSVENETSLRTIGNATLMVSTQSAPPPSPDMVFVTIERSNAQEIKISFNWDEIQYNCSSLQYNFTSISCGNCVSIAPTEVNCNSFMTSTAGIMCSFSVRTKICGNIFGEERTSTINLKVPAAPIIHCIPLYVNGQINILTQLITTFDTVEPFSISESDEIDGSATNYTITYSDSIFGTICGSFNISALSCIEGKCTHTFDVLTSSVCPQTSAITVNVFAVNVLGRGPPSNGLVRDGINNLVKVEFSSTDRSIMCTFINQQSDMLKRCTANITYGSNCDQHLGMYTGEGTGDKVKTLSIGKAAGVDEYCFLVNATSRNITVLVQGNLLNLDSQASLGAAIALPLIVLLLFVLTLLIVAIAVAVKYYNKSVGESSVSISFSIKDQPGSLAKALKVFKDFNINILGLNTHLHHAKFDRDAGKGYKFNYIHCLCTKSDREYLKKELMAEFEDSKDDGVVPITAIIKVKDCPGALWNAIHTIGDRGINIIGVNTLSDRKSTPGYKLNYVKCCCSQENLHRVRTALKLVTEREVDIKFLDEELHEEKAIEYLVRDKIGALADTLQVISDLGINISGVNLDHLPSHINRTTPHGLKINFIECSIDRHRKETLFNQLIREYGAVMVETHELFPEKLEEDPNYCVVKVTLHNETGSLNRILKAFCDLRINIKGVNVLEPAFSREKEVPYKHYHLEITSTNDQEAQLKKRLLAQGLAIDIKPFELSKHQESDHASDIQSNLESHCVSDPQESDHDHSSTIDVSPSQKIIQFLVRDEVGTLANALLIFSELGINITKVNPAHLPQEHQDEFVECSCAENQRESLINRLKSCGAIKAELLPDKEVQQHRLFVDANYCVIRFSLLPEVGSFERVLKAFSEMRVKIFKVNPPHIKVHNQYVECCCTEEEREKLLTKLEEIHGVTHVTLAPQDTVSARPTQDPNYCIIKYSIGDRAGTIVRALRVFFDLNINIIGVNTLNLAFNRTVRVKYKHNHVELLATNEQEEELKHQLLVTGLAIDVKPYKYIQRNKNLKSQSGNDCIETSV